MDDPGEQPGIDTLTPMVGRRIARIEQVFYVFKGAVDRSDCVLQLRMDDGSVVHFATGADGASLRVVVGSWVDPFPEPLSEENRAYVESHGKWTAFDTSATPEMAPLDGQIVRRVLPIRDQAGLRRGVQLDLGDEQVTYVVDGDEGFVYRGPATIELRMLGFFLDPLDAPALDSRPHEQD